jgi:hypothetical protein
MKDNDLMELIKWAYNEIQTTPPNLQFALLGILLIRFKKAIKEEAQK